MTAHTRSDLVAVIPAHNAARTLARCIDAIVRSTVRPSRIVLVDDASTDATVDIASEKGCEVVRLTANSGPGKARNAGAARAGDCAFLCVIDSDVVIQEDAIALLLQRVETEGHAAASAVYAPGTSGLGFFGAYKNLYSSYKWRRLQGPTTILNCSAAVIRKNLFDAVGGMDEAMRIGEDADLGTKLARGHTVWLDGSAQAAHLRPYTLTGLIKDTFVKGRLLACYALRRRSEANAADRAGRQVLSFPYAEIVGFFLGPASLVCGLAAFKVGALGAASAAALLVLFWTLRAPYILYIIKEKGPLFVLGAMVYMPIESLVCLAALVSGVGLALSTGAAPRERASAPESSPK